MFPVLYFVFLFILFTLLDLDFLFCYSGAGVILCLAVCLSVQDILFNTYEFITFLFSNGLQVSYHFGLFYLVFILFYCYSKRRLYLCLSLRTRICVLSYNDYFLTILLDHTYLYLINESILYLFILLLNLYIILKSYYLFSGFLLLKCQCN